MVLDVTTLIKSIQKLFRSAGVYWFLSAIMIHSLNTGEVERERRELILFTMCGVSYPTVIAEVIRRLIYKFMTYNYQLSHF